MDLSDRLQRMEPMSAGPNELDLSLLELPPQYEILTQVAVGGMGSVFRAKNRYTGANVAIKVMRSEAAQNQTAIQRFFLEAKATSLLKHSNICRLLDFGVGKNNGMPYLVMDWVDGINLEKKILSGYRFAMPEALTIFRQVASALAHAHQKKIIHRDLKPENIMVNYNANGQIEVQLVDFGIAKMFGDPSVQDNAMTKVGIAVGTPAYMSPEQARGLAVDPRTDVYSLGCVMYFTVTGKAPFGGGTTRQVMEKHLYQQPPAIDAALQIPHGLKMIIQKAMNKETKFRYANMDQLVNDLDQLINPPQTTTESVAVKSNPVKKALIWLFWFVISFSVVFLASKAILNLPDEPDAPTAKNTMLHHNHK